MTLCTAPYLQEDEVLAFQKRLEADQFDFNDFLEQFKRMNNMGGLQMLKLMPGFGSVSEKQLYEVEKKMKRYESMIGSMTPEVRVTYWRKCTRKDPVCDSSHQCK